LFFPFFISLFYFTSFSPGIFYISGNLSSSSLTNSTFTNITSLYIVSYTYGGAISIDIINGYSSFTIDRCIFTQCKADHGGALFLNPHTPYIYISRTRFENNDADGDGDDIRVPTSPCFNLAKSGSLDSSVCSTTPLGDRVNCSGDTSQLQNNRSKEAV
jgi:hypothetical protein